MSSQIYDFTLAAAVGATQRLDVVGVAALIRSATGGAVEITTDTGRKYRCDAGQGFTLKGGEFKFVTLRNLQAVANVGLIYLGDDEYEDRTITGTVNTVDGERLKVIQGVCFRGIASVAGGGAGGPIAQVWNTSTTKNVYVGAVRIGASAADSWSLYSSTTQAPTLIGTGANLDRTAAASLATMRSGNDGTAYGGVQNLAIGYIGASSDLLTLLPKPVLLRPGAGLIVQATSLATNLRATFEWEEWPI